MKKVALKFYLQDMSLSQLVEMPINKRMEVLKLLGVKGRIQVFRKQVKLTNLLKVKVKEEDGKVKTTVVTKKEKLAHLKKCPRGRFWDKAEYEGKHLGGFTYIKNCLVSCKGDVVFLDVKKGYLTIYSALDVERLSGKLNSIRFGEKGEHLYIGRMVACTFLPPPKGSCPGELMVIHLNKKKFDDRWNNLKWLKIKTPLLENGNYLVEIVEGPFKGKVFKIREWRFAKLGLDNATVASVVSGVKKTAYGCKFEKISWRNYKHFIFDDYKEFVKHTEKYLLEVKLKEKALAESGEPLQSGNFIGDIVYSFK